MRPGLVCIIFNRCFSVSGDIVGFYVFVKCSLGPRAFMGRGTKLGLGTAVL